jgi:hypothetical protein
MLKQYKKYNTCSNTFRFTHEPSSGSSPVLSYNYRIFISVLVGIDAVNVISACCAGVQFTVETGIVSTVNCTPAQQADISLTASIQTSTEKTIFVVLAKHRTAPW